jgi:hypothetical protein
MELVFERGGVCLRIETIRDARSGDFVLILHQADGTQLIDRFKTQRKFQKRLDDLERELLASRWTSMGSARLPDDRQPSR